MFGLWASSRFWAPEEQRWASSRARVGKNALHSRIRERDWAGALDWIDWYKAEAPRDVTALVLHAMVLAPILSHNGMLSVRASSQF